MAIAAVASGNESPPYRSIMVQSQRRVDGSPSRVGSVSAPPATQESLEKVKKFANLLQSLYQQPSTLPPLSRSVSEGGVPTADSSPTSGFVLVNKPALSPGLTSLPKGSFFAASSSSTVPAATALPPSPILSVTSKPVDQDPPVPAAAPIAPVMPSMTDAASQVVVVKAPEPMTDAEFQETLVRVTVSLFSTSEALKKVNMQPQSGIQRPLREAVMRYWIENAPPKAILPPKEPLQGTFESAREGLFRASSTITAINLKWSLYKGPRLDESPPLKI